MNLKTKEAPRYIIQSVDVLVRTPADFLDTPGAPTFGVFDRNQSESIAWCHSENDAEAIVAAMNYLHHGAGIVRVPEKGSVEIAERIFRSARLDEERLDWLDEFSCDRLEDMRGYILNSNGDETVRDVIDRFMKIDNSERDKL